MSKKPDVLEFSRIDPATYQPIVGGDRIAIATNQIAVIQPRSGLTSDNTGIYLTLGQPDTTELSQILLGGSADEVANAIGMDNVILLTVAGGSGCYIVLDWIAGVTTGEPGGPGGTAQGVNVFGDSFVKNGVSQSFETITSALGRVQTIS